MLVDAADRPGPRPLDRNQQVLLDRQIGEDSPAFRHVSHAGLGDAVGREPGHVGAEQRDAALPRRGEADETAQRRRLAGAVAAEQRDDLARAHFEADPVKDVALAVEGMNVGGLERDHVRTLPR